MDEYASDFDRLTLLFLFDSEKERSQNVISHVIYPIVQETRDLIKVFAFDCRDEEVKANPGRFEACKRPEELPYIWLMKPPSTRVDPSTLEPNKPENIPYNQTELTPTNFYNFVVNNMPDITTLVETVKQL